MKFLKQYNNSHFNCVSNFINIHYVNKRIDILFVKYQQEGSYKMYLKLLIYYFLQKGDNNISR